jgi:outer membrane receptor protein involved in Fe transport
LCLILLSLLVIGLPLTAAAQTDTGRVTGVVTDTTGGVLPGVTVTAKGATPGAGHSTVTDANGRFTIEKLAPGPYTLTYELAGFATQTANVVVVVGQPVTVETKLAIGGRTEAIQVTGSLIPRPTLEAMSPVTTLEVEELTYRGITRVEDLLTTLPQVFASGQNSNVSNGSNGTATVDLRGLGSSRTLVLVDGRRIGAGDTGNPAPDLNFIPSALVKRVDVLTGGASATYGADAVAGVVNFVLDRDFTGFRGGVEYSAYQHNNSNTLAQSMNAAKGFSYPSGNIWNDGPSDFNIALGGKFGDGKGHATFYLDYRTNNAITKDQRDYSNCSILGGETMSGPTCSGSATWQYGRFQVTPKAGGASTIYVLDGTTGLMRLRTSADVYNYAPVNFMQRPDKRWAGGSFINYEWNKHLGMYGDVMVMEDKTDAQIAPSGDFNNTNQVNCNNPMLSAQEVTLLCTNMGYASTDIANVLIGRRNVEGGGRVSHLEHIDMRYNAGVKGEINNVFKYDVYALQSTVHAPNTYANDFNKNAIQNALLVTGTPGQPSTWKCTNDTANCVPWNVFSLNSVSPASLAYLSLDEAQNTGTRTRVVSGKITGDLKDYGIASPMATEGIKIAVGTEYRQEYMFVHSDIAFEQALGAGSGGPQKSIEGTYSVKEIFGEALIPLVQDRPFMKDLSLEAGYRLSDYSSTGSHSTYKLQASFAPTPDVKVRVGYNRATRSPNISELYYPQALGLGGSGDVCAGAHPTKTAAQCALMGVSSALYGSITPNPANQYNTLGGGNPNLSPEVANTWTGGLVVTPRKFLPGFTAALDYYNIKINQTIGTLGSLDIQNQCAATGNAYLCGLIHRDSYGSLWLTNDGYSITTNLNVGQLRRQGLDVNATYTRPMPHDLGVFSVNFIGSYLMNAEINTGLYSYDCAGYYGNTCDPGSAPFPKWRHLARFSWETPWRVTVSVGWRMINGEAIDESSPNTALANPADMPLQIANGIATIPAYHYMDIGATWKIRKGITFIAGVNNVLDKEPPFAPGQTPWDYAVGFYGTYDALGRYIHTSLQFTF